MLQIGELTKIGLPGDRDELCLALRELLPADIHVAAGPLIAASLTARERISLGPVSAYRLREFAAGRAYAKKALAELGLPACDLPVGADRAPVWPAGVVGSISHLKTGLDSGFAAAALTRNDRVAKVGIDLELEQSLDPGLFANVLTERELGEVLALPVPLRCAEVTYKWCAKEVAIKIRGGLLEPDKIEVKRGAANGYFVATFPDERKPVTGRTGCWTQIYMAAAVVPSE